MGYFGKRIVRSATPPPPPNGDIDEVVNAATRARLTVFATTVPGRNGETRTEYWLVDDKMRMKRRLEEGEYKDYVETAVLPDDLPSCEGKRSIDTPKADDPQTPPHHPWESVVTSLEHNPPQEVKGRWVVLEVRPAHPAAPEVRPTVVQRILRFLNLG